MDFKSILKLQAIILIILSFFFISTVVVGIIYNENISKLTTLIELLFGTSILILYFLRNHKMNLNIKESILSVNILWILLGIVGAIPLYLYTNIDFYGAFFESISGFTTTGATAYSDVEILPHIVLYHRSLIHWIGGMGIIVLGVGLLSMINPTGSLSLFKAESSGIETEKITPRIANTAIRLWGIYVALTVANFLFLLIFGMDYFDAINHAFSTISTGGFSTKNSSIGFYNSYAILWITILFMLFSSINFLATFKLLSGDFSGYKREDTKLFFVIFLVLTISLTLTHYLTSSDKLDFALTHSAFTIASVMSTTGFATLNYEQWGYLSISIIFLSMLAGGNTGSTAGGIKIIRHIIIFKTLSAEFKKIIHPSAIISVFINSQKLQISILISTFGFVFLYIFTILSISIYLYSNGYDEMSSIFTAIATVGNIGPGFALTGPAQNYSFFTSIDKVVLSIGMIIGRLEFYTFLILFSKNFWKRF